MKDDMKLNLFNDSTVVEIQHKGIECFLSFKNNKYKMYSNETQEIVLSDEMKEKLESLKEDDYIKNFHIEGILCHVDLRGKEYDTENEKTELIFYATDILNFNEEDFREYDLLTRKVELQSLLNYCTMTYDDNSPIRFNNYFCGEQKELLLKEAKKQKFKGLVLRNIHENYNEKDDKILKIE